MYVCSAGKLCNLTLLAAPQSNNLLSRVIGALIYIQAKLKYAMNEVILDLVSTRKGLNPERINIGLRAFLLVADSLEKNVNHWTTVLLLSWCCQ